MQIYLSDLIENSIMNNSFNLNIPNKIKKEFENKIMTMVAYIVAEAKQRDAYKMFNYSQYLNMLIYGGGSKADWYKKTILNTYDNRKHRNCGIPVYENISLPLPDNFSYNKLPADDFYRFFVAYGLSVPKGEEPPIEGFPRANPRLDHNYKDRSTEMDKIQLENYGEIL